MDHVNLLFFCSLIERASAEGSQSEANVERINHNRRSDGERKDAGNVQT